MNLNQYIRDIRNRTDDDPKGGVPPYHTDAQLITFINNARRKIAIDMKCYLKQLYLIPELYIDEYGLNPDYLEASIVLDIYNQIEYYPINQANVETTKMWYDSVISYGNFSFINTTRRKLNLLNTVASTAIEPTYTVQSFSRANKTLVVNAVSTGNVNGITKWDKVKGYIKATTSSGNSEYIRYSKVLADTPTTNVYTLYLSANDLESKYKDNILVYGTVAISSTNTNIYGTNTKFTVDLTAGDLITVGSVTKSIDTITSDTIVNVNTAFSTTSSGNSAYVDNKIIFAGSDTLKFISYIMNYYGIPKDLQYYNEEDGMDISIQHLIPILASSEAWNRRSRKDMSLQELNEYNQEAQKLAIKLNQTKAHMSNKGKYF